MSTYSEEEGPVMVKWTIAQTPPPPPPQAPCGRFSTCLKLDGLQYAKLERNIRPESRFRDRKDDYHFSNYWFDSILSNSTPEIKQHDPTTHPYIFLVPFSSLQNLECTRPNTSIFVDDIDSVLESFRKIDGFSHDYYRHIFLWRLARDYFGIVPLIDINTLAEALPPMKLILGCVMYALNLQAVCTQNGSGDNDNVDSILLNMWKDQLVKTSACLVREYKQVIMASDQWALRLRRAYREQRPHIRFLIDMIDKECPLDWTRVDFMDRVVSILANDEISQRYPPSKPEQAEFWSALARTIEARDHEVHETILQHTLSASLQGLAAGQMFALSSVPGEGDDLPDAHRTFEYGTAQEGSHSRTITVRMNRDIQDNVGLTSWPAGFAMSEYILHMPHLFQGKRCLELGAGIGVTAIICAQLKKGTFVIGTDYDKRTLDNMKHNAVINGVPLVEIANDTEVKDSNTSGDMSLCVEQLDWSNYEQKRIAAYAPEVVFSCDTIYDPDFNGYLARLIVNILSCSSSSSPPLVLFAQQKRNPETYASFIQTCKDEGLAIDYIQVEPGVLGQRFPSDQLDLLQLFRLSLAE